MLDRGSTAGLAASLVLAAAIVVPTAGANRYGPGRTPQHAPATHQTRPAATCHQYCGTGPAGRASQPRAGRAIVRTELVPSSDAGFHWADAAVGFAVAWAGILLVLLTLLGARRTRIRPAGGAS
jgi:hypothetical protein